MFRFRNLAWIFCWFGLAVSQARADQSVQIPVNDQEMTSAIAKARDTLPIFLSHVIRSDGKGLLEASVKVSFKVDQGKIVDEYLWVGPFKENNDGTFSGYLANDPVHLDLEIGDEVQFDISQILDWSVWLRDEKNYGSYTTRALLDMLPEEQAADLRSDLSVKPLPENWRLE